MSSIISRLRLRVVGLTGSNTLRVMMREEGQSVEECPFDLDAAKLHPQCRIPNTELVRVIDHVIGREWIEDVNGTVLGILHEGLKDREQPVRANPNPIAPALRYLLNDLDVIAEAHDEVRDTDVRERMFEAIRRTYITSDSSYTLPDDFGMFSKKGNELVKTALSRFLRAACVRQCDPVKSKEARLNDFQDPQIQSAAGSYYDDYFGHSEEV